MHWWFCLLSDVTVDLLQGHVFPQIHIVLLFMWFVIVQQQFTECTIPENEMVFLFKRKQNNCSIENKCEAQDELLIVFGGFLCLIVGV